MLCSWLKRLRTGEMENVVITVEFSSRPFSAKFELLICWIHQISSIVKCFFSLLKRIYYRFSIKSLLYGQALFIMNYLQILLSAQVSSCFNLYFFTSTLYTRVLAIILTTRVASLRIKEKCTKHMCRLVTRVTKRMYR